LPVGPAAVTPLSPDRYKLQLTIGGDTLEKLRLAKDMLGHAIPSGDDAAILDWALTALLAELAKKKFSDTRKPRPSRGTKAGARDPSAPVKRAVWLRDLGRCAFIGTTGHRCNERRFIEFHHIDPHALGGEATVDQIQLRCRRHNDYEGRLYFGKRRRGGDNGIVREEPARYMLNAVGEAGTSDPSGTVASALAPGLRSLVRLAAACIGPVGALAGTGVPTGRE
jgi:hypothetical protein